MIKKMTGAELTLEVEDIKQREIEFQQDTRDRLLNIEKTLAKIEVALEPIIAERFDKKAVTTFTLKLYKVVLAVASFAAVLTGLLYTIYHLIFRR